VQILRVLGAFAELQKYFYSFANMLKRVML